jgi:excisionase family DNA binding protein
MTTMTDLRLPTSQESDEAQAAVRRLRELHLPEGQGAVRLRAAEDGEEASVTIPRAAFDLLLDLLSQLANGNAVTVVPVHAELTTQQAADLLNVSRPHLVSLLEAGKLEFRRVGNHRRIRFQDLMEYRRIQMQQSKAALTELAAEAQRLNLGY